MDEFEQLTSTYDMLYQTKHIKHSRKNFINSQYVLYQLLLKHNHICNKDDFALLKTLNTRKEHDLICKELFEYLGWNFTNSI